MHINIRINPVREQAATWGDYNYARSLKKALTEKGVSAQITFRDDPIFDPRDDCATLHITGPHIPDPFDYPAQLLWMISVPNIATHARLAQFDHVFVASQSLSEVFRHFGSQASYLPQMTDIDHFMPSRAPAGQPDIPISFVGNSSNNRQARRLIFDVIEAGFDVQIWGRGWNGVVPKRYHIGTVLNYNELADIYARSHVVLNSVIDGMQHSGIMSNRSFDALASGACVFSDAVYKFTDSYDGDLVQRDPERSIEEQLLPLLDVERHTSEIRQHRHNQMRDTHSFSIAADHIITQAAAAVQTPRAKTIPVSWLRPAATVGNRAVDEIGLAAIEILQLLSSEPLPSDPSHRDEGQIIHFLSRDLRRLRQGEIIEESERRNLAIKARRILELINHRDGPFMQLPNVLHASEIVIQRFANDTPQFVKHSANIDRARERTHVALWPQDKPPKLARPIGVFIHLFYDELAPLFAQELQKIAHPYQLYISTDTAEKATRLRAHFPEADVRVFENRGRDIYPKLYGFGDRYEHHDIVLHLHGKRSAYSKRLDSWLEHNLSCLLPSVEEVNRIFSFFNNVAPLGLVAPAPFPKLLHALHWVFNYDIASDLADRMGISDLPDGRSLTFPAGSMFYARVDALRPLLDLRLTPANFSPEHGQLDGTLAHAIERLIGVVCQAQGYEMLTVVPKGSSLYRRHRIHCKTNDDVTAYLRATTPAIE